MDKYIPGEVYDNLVKLFSYRNAAITSEIINRQKLSEQLNHYEYVTIAGTRMGDSVRDNANILIVMIAGMSKFSNKSAEFAKLFKLIPKSTPGMKREVIFVSENKLTVHIIKKIYKYKIEIADPELHIETYDYNLFKIEVPKHAEVPKHSIASKEEVKEFCNRYYTLPERFPKILPTDPQAVWIGLRPGMVCRIERISETAGTALAYRLCSGGEY